MELYLAPMEEITGYIFRNVTDRHFPGADRFITPFVSPNQKNILKTKDGREIVPEHNAGKKVAIQILSNNAQETIELMQRLQEYGYNDIDFNFGIKYEIGNIVKIIIFNVFFSKIFPISTKPSANFNAVSTLSAKR